MALLGVNSPVQIEGAEFGPARAEVVVRGGEPVLRILWPEKEEALLGLVNVLAGRGARTQMIPGHRWTTVEIVYTQRLAERLRLLIEFLRAIKAVDPQLRQLELVAFLETVETVAV